MKKVLAVILMTLLVLSMFACTGQNAAPAAPEAPAAPAASADEPAAAGEEKPAAKPIKIGFLFSDFENTLGQMVKAQMEEAAKALNIEFVYVADNEVADDQINSLDNILSTGVDGVLIAPASVSICPKIVSMCEEAGVPVMCCFRDITYDSAVLAQVENNPYYLGCTFEGETTAAYNMCKFMNGIGKTKMGFIWFPAGSPLVDTRQAGMYKAIEEGIVTEAGSWTWDGSDGTNSMVEGCEYFVTTCAGQVDSILLISSAIAGSATTAVLEEYNVAGDVMIATFDQFEGMEDAFDSGSLALSVCGHHTDPLYALMVLYNKINGTPVSDKPVALECNYLYLSSSEDCKDFSEYMLLNKIVYSQEDILKMVGPDFTVDDLKLIMQNYSMEIL